MNFYDPRVPPYRSGTVHVLHVAGHVLVEVCPLLRQCGCSLHRLDRSPVRMIYQPFQLVVSTRGTRAENACFAMLPIRLSKDTWQRACPTAGLPVVSLSI